MCDTKRSIGRKCESGLAANVPLRGVFVQDYDSHTQPKLTNRRIQMDAQTRRRERRAEKQAQWKADRILASTFRRNATKRHY
ncbi:antitermination protein N [Escherichia coli]|uniref:Phage early gene regulator n=4 Tax=Enterobacteriaceae TaxID=543 RepID=A0A0H3JFJ5_ECO57|nr:antitermination protein N [Escherichia coli]NP_308299.1 phage early gene regulator [Escherichia coli O157:H7 str. Sakai]EET3529143.1 antitermination protein [Escherichia coli O157:NM]EFW4747726.1 antitermination protein [Shigella sonnei]EFW8299992.1 antitermination protein [Shigella flexneri]EJY0126429.1 antitermination protein [Escherichia coli O116]EJY0205098.1 antitermination protein [Escherichia coli O113]EKG3694081.1 antitermination protein [Escherichia coli O2]HDR6113399.1 antiterm